MQNHILIHRLPKSEINSKDEIMEIIVQDEYCTVYDSLTHYTQRKILGKLNKYDIYESIPIYHDQTDCYYKVWFEEKIGYISSRHVTWFGYDESRVYGMTSEIIATQSIF